VGEVRHKLNQDDNWGEIVDRAIDDARNGGASARKFLADIAIPPLDNVTPADIERVVRLRREAEQMIGLGGPVEIAADPSLEEFKSDPGAWLEAARRHREGS
jgi:hypothetical protein